MNTFLERSWGSAHPKLIRLIDDEIARQLPRDLIARPEERIVIDQVTPPVGLRPDITVSET